LSSLPRSIESIENRVQTEPLNYEHRKLRDATVSFEAMFVKELLKTGGGKMARGMFGGGMAEEFFQDFLNDERSKTMVKGGGFGIAKMLEKEILAADQKRLNIKSDLADKVIMNVNQMQAKQVYQ
jgi:Rod binding domain-containing protein